MQHSFNTKIAEKYGMAAAVIYEIHNINFFSVEKPKAVGVTLKELCAVIHYMTEAQIKYALDKLVAGGIVQKKKRKNMDFDQTILYTLPMIDEKRDYKEDKNA